MNETFKRKSFTALLVGALMCFAAAAGAAPPGPSEAETLRSPVAAAYDVVAVVDLQFAGVEVQGARGLATENAGEAAPALDFAVHFTKPVLFHAALSPEKPKDARFVPALLQSRQDLARVRALHERLADRRA